MAKQVGPLFVTGTIDGIIFYKLNGQYYMRSKGDYKSGKMMRKDPRLKRTMQNAAQFGVASKLVKRVYYRHLPNEVRRPGLFAQLTGRVKRWLYEGKTKEEARELLIAYLQTLVPVEKKASTSAPELPATQPANPVQQQAATPDHNPKQARYLSKWKVKRNGRLHIPRSVNALPTIPSTNSAIAPQLKE